MKNKKSMLKTILIALILIIVIILYLEKICNVEIVDNVKSAISKQISLVTGQLEDELSTVTENIDPTTIDVTNLEDNGNLLHEHFFKTMYDENKHWEECTVCGEKQNENNHTYEKTWTGVKDSCSPTSMYSNTCSCGYSVEGYKPCVWNGKYATGSYLHYKRCIDSGNHLIGRGYYLNTYGVGEICETNQRGQCHLSNGTLINCKTGGRCAECGISWGTGMHAITNRNNNLICIYCGENFGTYSFTAVSDNNMPKKYTVIGKLNLTNGATFNRISSLADDPYSRYQSYETSVVEKNSNNTSVTLKVTAQLRADIKKVVGDYFYIVLQIGGKQIPTSATNFTISPDTVAPEIEIENEQLNEWSRTKPIKISGTENWCNTVNIKIVDEEENNIYSGETVVSNGNYSALCIPEIEVPTEGRKFRVIVTDTCNNSSSQEFTITKVDAIPPTPTSGNEILGEWAKSKDFTFTATDYGIGQVSIAFNDIKDLQLANVDENIYSRDYTFTGDVYNPKVLSVIYKDGLGNASMQKITINKLDNTVPTIISAILSNNKLSIVANDEHETLGEGSGVTKYKYITSDTRLVNPEVTIDWKESSSNEIVVEDVYKAKYIYVVAEDLVGNISSVYEIIVPELILDTEVDLSLSNGKGGVNLDWSTYDATNKVFKAYHKKDDVADADWEIILDNDNATKFIDNLTQDTKAPDAPTMSAGQVGITKDIQISFNTKDNGSTYSFYVESYDSIDTSIKLSVSNERTETVTTGVKGYYYIIDEDSSNKDFDITSPEVKYTTDENILVHISNNGKYIHMKADDKAGNVSEPSTYKIDLKIIDIDEEITIELTKTWIDNNVQRLRRPDKLRFVVVPVQESDEIKTISSNNNVLYDNAILPKEDSTQNNSEELKEETSQGKTELDETVREEPQIVGENKDSISGETQSSSLDEDKTKEENSSDGLELENNKTEENQVETSRKENSILENAEDESNKSQQTHEVLDKLNEIVNEKAVLENIVSKETIKSRMSIRFPEEKTSNNEVINSLVDEKNTTNEISNKAYDVINNNIEKIENKVKPSELESLENVTSSNKIETLDEENETNKETNIKNNTVEDEVLEDNANVNSTIEDTKTENKLENSNTQMNNEITLEENPVDIEEGIESYTYEFEVDKTVSSQVFNLAGILRYEQTTGKPMKYIIKEEEVNEGDLKFYETTGGEVEKIADSEGNIVKYTAEIINKFKLPEGNIKEVKVTKIWNDDNQIAIRPTSVILELIGRVKDIEIIEESETLNIVEQQSDAEETPKQEEQTNEIMSDRNNQFSYKTISSKEGRVSAESEWKHVYTELPIYDENGQEIEYIAQEKEGQVELDKYISEVSKINEVNEITVTNNLIIRNSNMTKTGPEEITSIDSNVPYNINYEVELDNTYTENMVIEIVDTLPYQIEKEKSNLKGGIYNYNEGTKVATITWKGKYNPVSKTIIWEKGTEESDSEVEEIPINLEIIENAEKNTQTLRANIEISVIYKDINVLNERIVNKVSGKITLSNNVEEKVESTFETVTKWIRNITVTKLWKGDTEETRPESIELQLSASIKDENNQDIAYVLDESIEKTKILSKDMDWTEMLWTNLPSYDESGREIHYTVEEIDIDGYKSEILEINKNLSDIEITIENTKLYKLPITGGIGVDTIRNLEVLVGIIVLIVLTNRKKIKPSRRSVIKVKRAKDLERLALKYNNK